MRIYLGGPINGCTDEEAHGWRDAAKPIIEEAGHKWVDPMDRDYRGREMEPGIARQIVELDKQDIDSCDTVVIYSPKPSDGKAMEIYHAWLQSKRIVVVAPDDVILSPWVVYHSDGVLRGSVVDAIRIVCEEAV